MDDDETLLAIPVPQQSTVRYTSILEVAKAIATIVGEKGRG